MVIEDKITSKLKKRKKKHYLCLNAHKVLVHLDKFN